jgi:hypothetical protein
MRISRRQGQDVQMSRLNCRPFLLNLNLLFPFSLEPIPKWNFSGGGEPFGIKDITRV